MMASLAQQKTPNTAPLCGIFDVHPTLERASRTGWRESARFQALCKEDGTKFQTTIA